MGIIESFNKFVTEYGLSIVQKERLLLFCDQIEKLEKENQRLTQANHALQTERDTLKEQLEHKLSTDEFVQHRGVLFLRLPDGKIQDQVYCPKCHGPMVAQESFVNFRCKPCGVGSGFTGDDLIRVISEIA